jgi:hypothetical protein
MVREISVAHDFYEGNQWRGLKTGGDELPIIDRIGPDVDYKVAVVTQNLMEIVYSPMNYDDPAFQLQGEELCRKLNAQVARWWENENMDDVCLEVVEDACICRGKYMYFYYVEGKTEVKNGVEVEVEPGRIEFNLLDPTNIMFADEQERKIQKQPYILIPVRERVQKIRDEAVYYRKKGKNKLTEGQEMGIVADSETELEAGYRAKEEVEHGADDPNGKAIRVLKLWMQDGQVYMSKAVKNMVYLEAEPTGLKLYPVTGFVWSRVKGTCRGQGVVNKLIPNQIAINRIAGYRYMNVKMTAFPKPVVDTSVVQNPEDVTKFGTQIEVDGSSAPGGLSTVLNAVGYLQPAATGQDAKAVQDELVRYTDDALNVSDVARGNTQIETYRAIMAIQEMAAAPLNSKQLTRYKRFIEDIARILFDMQRNYFRFGIKVVQKQEIAAGEPRTDGKGNPVEPEMAEVEVEETIPAELLEKLRLNVKVDITPVSPFNKFMQQQQADNLLQSQKGIEFAEYVELIPESDPMKTKLEKIVAARGQLQQLLTKLEELQAYSAELEQQVAADQETLREAGITIQKTAQAGVEQGQAAREEGRLEGQIQAAANLPSIQGGK